MTSKIEDMDRAAITILMPLKYYDTGFLRKSLESAIEQSSSRWRLLIIVQAVDYDEIRSLLEEDIRDERVKIIISEGRKLAGQINTGIRTARTEFVALLFADDMWSRDAVKVLLEYRDRYPNVDFFHSSRQCIDEEDNVISSIYYSKEKFDLADFKYGSPVKHLLCWRREKALAVGGLDESLNTGGGTG